VAVSSNVVPDRVRLDIRAGRGNPFEPPRGFRKHARGIGRAEEWHRTSRTIDWYNFDSSLSGFTWTRFVNSVDFFARTTFEDDGLGQRVGLIVHELIENAVRYGDEKELEVRLERTGDEVLICVVNTTTDERASKAAQGLR